MPEAIAVSRTTVCAAGGGLAALTRLQSVALYGGYLAYYWWGLLLPGVEGAVEQGVCLCQRVCCRPRAAFGAAPAGCKAPAVCPPARVPAPAVPPRRVLATPAVGFLFGCYLYISVNW